MKPLTPTLLRGEILKFLKYTYPDRVDERVIVGSLYVYHDYDDIVESLSYLVDKGYAERKEVPHPYKPVEKIRMYKISTTGIDLIDGTHDDPAVLVVPEES